MNKLESDSTSIKTPIYSYGLLVSYLDLIKDQEVQMIKNSKQYYKKLLLARINPNNRYINGNNLIYEYLSIYIDSIRDISIIFDINSDDTKDIINILKNYINHLKDESILYLEIGRDPDKIEIDLDLPSYFYMDKVPSKEEILDKRDTDKININALHLYDNLIKL